MDTELLSLLLLTRKFSLPPIKAKCTASVLL